MVKPYKNTAEHNVQNLSTREAFDWFDVLTRCRDVKSRAAN